MALVARVSGGIVVSTTSGGEAAYFLVGDTKVPCDWASLGFQTPALRDAARVRWVRLVPCAAPALPEPSLRVPLEGEESARTIAERLLVERNGSVSERLWRLIVGEEPPIEAPLDAGWLVEMPPRIWQVIRDTVLKCS
jgi:hypothetical protein